MSRGLRGRVWDAINGKAVWILRVLPPPRNWLKRPAEIRRAPSGPGQLPEEVLIEPDAGFVVFDGEILVRGMDLTIRQGQSEKQCFCAEDFLEILDDRNAAAFADEGGVPGKGCVQGALGGFAKP